MFLIFKYMYQTITRILQFTKMVLDYLGPVCQPILSNFLSILNTLTHFFTHFFIHIYISKTLKQKYQNSITQTPLPNTLLNFKVSTNPSVCN